MYRYLYNDDVTASPVCGQYEIPIGLGPSTASAKDEKASADDIKASVDDTKASIDEANVSVDDEKVNTESLQDELKEDVTEPLIAESGTYTTIL